MSDILVMSNARTLGWDVRYQVSTKNGMLNRTIACGSDEDAAAHAIDVSRRLFSGRRKIVAPHSVAQYIPRDLLRGSRY